MEYQRVEPASRPETMIDRSQALWTVLLIITLFLSPLIYDLWSLLGGG
jgi:hypothetical protein